MCKQKQVDIIDITETETDYCYYRGRQLINIIQGQGQSQPGQRFFQTATGLAGQINLGGNARTWLIGSDVLGSVLAGSDGEGALEEHRYAPYGGEKHQETTKDVMKLGYTGAYRDPLTGSYPLGNGCRFYLPELMCFNKADSLSPFGVGGINTRSYCEGDPINYSDSSGHAKQSWMGYVSIGLGMLGILGAVCTGGALAVMGGILGGVSAISGGISRALPDEDEQAKDICGFVSLGLGIASAGFGCVAGLTKQAGRAAVPIAHFTTQAGEGEGELLMEIKGQSPEQLLSNIHRNIECNKKYKSLLVGGTPMQKSRILWRGVSDATRGSMEGDADPNYVFQYGIQAREPDAAVSVIEHITTGKCSPWISTSSDPDMALRFSSGDTLKGSHVYAIDPDLDITVKAINSQGLNPYSSEREYLVYQKIPASRIIGCGRPKMDNPALFGEEFIFNRNYQGRLRRW